MVTETRQILFITPEFPPASGSESIRSLRCVKYLPRFGWYPIVLTAKHPRAMSDESLVSELPKGLLIYRVHSLENKTVYYFTAFLGKLLGCPFLPDYKLGWQLLATGAGKKILKNHRIEAIISRSSPVASHLVALRLKAGFDLPWVADFSDPWTQNPYIKYRNPLAYQWDARLENRVVHLADKIIFTTQQARLDFLAKHTDISPDKVAVIPNAYDPQWFVPVKQTSNSSEFTITHVGSLGRLRSPELFFKALAQLKATDKVRARVLMVGGAGTFGLVKGLVARYGLEDTVRIVERVPHREVPNYLGNADLLLLIDAPIAPSPFLPMKLPEYLATGKPILAITPEGASADMVRTTKTGIVVSPHDIEGIKKALKDYYVRYQNASLKLEPDWSEIAQYSAEKCTEELGHLIDGLVARKGNKS